MVDVVDGGRGCGGELSRAEAETRGGPATPGVGGDGPLVESSHHPTGR